MQHHGWYIEKTHGNQYQEGFPDLLAMHPRYDPKWIECKVIDKGNQISCTPAQKRKFPIWIAHGVKIWCVAGIDFRGEAGKVHLLRAYQKLFGPPNGYKLLHHTDRNLLAQEMLHG